MMPLLRSALLVLFIGSAATAQDRDRQTVAAPPRAPKIAMLEAAKKALESVVLSALHPAVPQRPPRDPTLPGPSLLPLLRKPSTNTPLPDVQLKGMILAQGQSPRAMLEIGKRMHMLAEGSKVSLPDSVEVLVNKISADGVELQVLPLQYTLSVR